MSSPAPPCPCGRPGNAADCCAAYVSGKRPAPDPESLMRSRYTAFALGTNEAIAYLVDTHRSEHRAPDLREGLRASIASVDAWEQLEVRSAEVDGDRGTVEFVATYRVAGERMQLHERSQFVREDGRWFYTEGVVS